MRTGMGSVDLAEPRVEPLEPFEVTLARLRALFAELDRLRAEGLSMMAALADVTAAYHHERAHDGHWSKCQRPRCQNTRLAAEGRGPFAALRHSLDPATTEPKEPE